MPVLEQPSLNETKKVGLTLSSAVLNKTALRVRFKFRNSFLMAASVLFPNFLRLYVERGGGGHKYSMLKCRAWVRIVFVCITSKNFEVKRKILRYRRACSLISFCN